MAIYHFTVTVLSRARGHRVIAAAASQSATKLHDDYYGMIHNQAHRPGVEFAEIIAPDQSPSWVFDREQLWNRVEAGERRKDSQLARALEISLPLEMNHQQRIDLLRDFIRAEFVAKGMIADIGIRRTKLDNPNAYVLLTLRTATPAGFGPKMRQWNGRRNLLDWRAAWANRANLHLARGGHILRIDHRSLDEQQVELTPARRTGVGRPLHQLDGLPEHLQARFAEQRRIAHANGAVIIEDPAIVIRALAHQRRIFTVADLVQFLRSRTDGPAQCEAALSSVMASPELAALEFMGGHPARYTSRDLIEAKRSLMRRARTLASRRSSAATQAVPDEALMLQGWSEPLRAAFSFVAGAGDFKALALPQEEMTVVLEAARAHWRAQARRVLERLPPANEAALSNQDVLIVTGAEMIDLKSLERILAAVERARAKVVLAADQEQLQAMGAMSPLLDLVGLEREFIAE